MLDLGPPVYCNRDADSGSGTRQRSDLGLLQFNFPTERLSAQLANLFQSVGRMVCRILPANKELEQSSTLAGMHPWQYVVGTRTIFLQIRRAIQRYSPVLLSIKKRVEP